MTLSAKKNLTQKRCAPCEGGVAIIAKKEALGYLKQMKGWHLAHDTKSIFAEWALKDFKTAIDLIDRIAKLAEKEDHHPDFHLTGYRTLRVELSTHAIAGLSINDFSLAALIDKLPKKYKSLKT